MEIMFFRDKKYTVFLDLSMCVVPCLLRISGFWALPLIQTISLPVAQRFLFEVGRSEQRLKLLVQKAAP